MKFLVIAHYKIDQLLRETLAQDLIEYALMAGFVATVAGAIMPNVSTSISKIFSKVSDLMADSSRAPSG